MYQIFCRRLISGKGIVNGRVSYLTICWDSALNPKICKFTLPLLYCRVAILQWDFEILLSLWNTSGLQFCLLNRLPGWENWSLFNVFFFLIYLYIYFRVEILFTILLVFKKDSFSQVKPEMDLFFEKKLVLRIWS